MTISTFHVFRSLRNRSFPIQRGCLARNHDQTCSGQDPERLVQDGLDRDRRERPVGVPRRHAPRPSALRTREIAMKMPRAVTTLAKRGHAATSAQRRRAGETAARSRRSPLASASSRIASGAVLSSVCPDVRRTSGSFLGASREKAHLLASRGGGARRYAGIRERHREEMLARSGHGEPCAGADVALLPPVPVRQWVCRCRSSFAPSLRSGPTCFRRSRASSWRRRFSSVVE